MLRILVVFGCALVLASCATPDSVPPLSSDAAIRLEQERQIASRVERYLAGLSIVQSVGHRIMLANAGFCGDDVGPRFGFGATTSPDIAKNWRKPAYERIGLSKELSVMYVAVGSSAQLAGLLLGDKILRVDGVNAPYGAGATAKFYEIITTRKSRRPMRLDIDRGGVRKTLYLRVVPGCNYPILFGEDNSVQAATDGSRIYVNRGLLKVASNEEELALVLGHELAHITRGHLDKQRHNQVVGMAGGFLVDVAFAAAGVDTGGIFTEAGGNSGLRAFSQGFELEADYVGLYYSANAGFDVEGAENLWRKMADEDPRIIRYAGTHPTAPERFLLIRNTTAEIYLKRKQGLPLVPDDKRALVVAKSASVKSGDN